MEISVVKKLINEISQFKRNIALCIFAGILASAGSAKILTLIKELTDAFANNSQQDLRTSLITIFISAAVVALGKYQYNYWINITSELITQHFRKKLHEKFMCLNLTFHNQYTAGSGGLITRSLSDIAFIQNGLRFFGDFIREPVLFIFIIFWLFKVNWQLTLSIIIILPVLLLFLRSIAKSVSKYAKLGQEQFERLTSTVKESLDGIRIIQSFNLEKEMSKKYNNEFLNYFSARKKIHARMSIASPITELIAISLVLGIIVYFYFEIAAGRATAGDFTSYLTSLAMINQPLKVLQDSYVRSQETLVSAKRVFEIMEENSEVPQSQSHDPFPQSWSEIKYENVSFAYGHEMVLKNVSFSIKKGEVVAFVGASGSGKSTIVNLLERFFDPSSGQILIDSTPIQNITLSELRRNIALVTQDVYLFSDTIEKNIWAGDFSKPKNLIEEAAISANAHSFITKLPLGYQSKVGERGALLSGGEKQRVSIARAVLKNAPILILDEATSALDSASEQEVQKGLDQLMSGRTALIIAHRLSTIARADRIFVVKSGQIVESGTQEELLSKKGEYFQLHQIQYQNA